ncbi:helix-turn-helix transcriptional regulator [Streptomyces mirabilis]|uniref:helix-turn-helix transcriptional regulator n=1 Tax=Streptomyces mirabilis TaxID=68239 RepID=UPI0036AB4705
MSPTRSRCARPRSRYGERLRRAKATQAARDQLNAALTTFTRLGASPWAHRARSELRASGLAAVRVGAAPDTRLSPQQYEIARLAAAGMTNKQIGQRLHLSPRTVGSHLYQVFPKLGITSRAALRDALQEAGKPANAGPKDTVPPQS